MYQPHNLLWFIPCALLCGLVAGMGGWFQKKGMLKWQTVSKFCVFGFIGCWFAVFFCKTYDDYKLREELRNIPPDGMSHFYLSEGSLNREIASSTDVSELMLRIQSLKNIAAHHSHPINPFEIAFQYQGQHYQYSIGQDSERPGEYWVNADEREGDIGRIQSNDLGQIVQNLLANRQQAIK